MIKATNGFAKYTDNDLLAKARFISSSMTGNADFPDPSPSLTNLDAVIKEFADAITEAEGKATVAVMHKKTKKTQLVQLLQQEGNYVTMVAAGDADTIARAGFDFTKPRSVPPPLQTPAAPKMRTGNTSGTMVVKVAYQKGVTGNCFYITDDPALPTEQWIDIQHPKGTVVFSDLKPATRYYAKVCQVSRRGNVESPISNYVTQ